MCFMRSGRQSIRVLQAAGPEQHEACSLQRMNRNTGAAVVKNCNWLWLCADWL